MGVGKLKVTSHGFDVTDEHRRRLQKVLDALEAFERDNGEALSG